MKKTAIVITTNVCRRTRSAISPTGTANRAATTAPPGGNRGKDLAPVQMLVLGHQGHRVRAHPEEHRVPERDVAGVAGEQVPARHGRDEHQRQHGELGVQWVRDPQGEYGDQGQGYRDAGPEQDCPGLDRAGLASAALPRAGLARAGLDWAGHYWALAALRPSRPAGRKAST